MAIATPGGRSTPTARLLSGVARVALVLRAVLCERAFAHVLDRGGMRRTWLRRRDDVVKRYLIQVAAYNRGLVMRGPGRGTPRALRDLRLLWLTVGDRRRHGRVPARSRS